MKSVPGVLMEPFAGAVRIALMETGTDLRSVPGVLG